MPRLLIAVLGNFAAGLLAADAVRPNIVLVMADDQGWGEVGYNGHPLLKTPHLDAMAASGLRFDRFYASAPVCSPTRAAVLTGRTNDRTGVRDHGYPLRRQEKTLAQALRAAGYSTGHFGKWHLDGYRGPGAPILAGNARSPGAFGFDVWISATNYIDRDPVLGRQGRIEEFNGDSSEILVQEALEFMTRQLSAGRPFFAVIWYGSPHVPSSAAGVDKVGFEELSPSAQNHLGELVALDRSIGALRSGLRRLGVAQDTLVWYCSDNGGHKDAPSKPVAHLRGFKGSLFEGGLRVPGIVEWPAGISRPRITSFPAGTIDIFPTVAAIAGLPASAHIAPLDGVSLKPLFAGEAGQRERPLGFRYLNGAAWIDNRYKLVAPDTESGGFQLYDLVDDPSESRDLSNARPDLAGRLRAQFLVWNASVVASAAGKDYPEGNVDAADLVRPRNWATDPEYRPYLPILRARPEYRRTFRP